MTVRTIRMVLELAPEEVEENRQDAALIATYPNEVAEVAGELGRVFAHDEDARERLAPILARMLEGSRLAHAASARLYGHLRRGVLHEARGPVQ